MQRLANLGGPCGWPHAPLLTLADPTQIAEISKRLEDMDVNDISDEYLTFALRSKYAGGNTEKAIEILLLHQRSISGIILPYNPNVNMLGAENRGNVTCYLDALLFAMFAKLEAFECMLKHDLSDEPQRNLAALIRLWVNMLRSGKLIHTDMVRALESKTLIKRKNLTNWYRRN